MTATRAEHVRDGCRNLADLSLRSAAGKGDDKMTSKRESDKSGENLQVNRIATQPLMD